MKIEIGKRVPEEIRSLINDLVSTDDLLEISESHPLSYSTLLGLTYGKTQVTKDNHTMIDGLIKKAIGNTDAKINHLNKIRPELDIIKNSYNLFHESLNQPVES